MKREIFVLVESRNNPEEHWFIGRGKVGDIVNWDIDRESMTFCGELEYFPTNSSNLIKKTDTIIQIGPFTLGRLGKQHQVTCVKDLFYLTFYVDPEIMAQEQFVRCL